MKITILVFISVILLIVLVSCGQTEEEKLAEQGWKIMEQQNNIQNNMVELAQKNANWEISDEEYDKQMGELNKWFENIESTDSWLSKISEDEFTSCAKKEGLRKIEWLTFSEKESEIIIKDSKWWFDAVNVMYTWNDYDKVIQEAEVLAKDMNIVEWDMSPRKSMSSIMDNMVWMGLTEEQLIEMQWNMNENMKWAMFSNCILWLDCKIENKYAKLISVEQEWEKWNLQVSVVNIEQWQWEMDKLNTLKQ
jgi:hypothetical protein